MTLEPEIHRALCDAAVKLEDEGEWVRAADAMRALGRTDVHWFRELAIRTCTRPRHEGMEAARYYRLEDLVCQAELLSSRRRVHWTEADDAMLHAWLGREPIEATADRLRRGVGGVRGRMQDLGWTVESVARKRDGWLTFSGLAVLLRAKKATIEGWFHMGCPAERYPGVPWIWLSLPVVRRWIIDQPYVSQNLTLPQRERLNIRPDDPLMLAQRAADRFGMSAAGIRGWGRAGAPVKKVKTRRGTTYDAYRVADLVAWLREPQNARRRGWLPVEVAERYGLREEVAA